MFENMPENVAESELQVIVQNAAGVLYQELEDSLMPTPKMKNILDERTYDSKIEAVEPSLENVSEFLQRSVKRAHFEAATVVGIVIIFKRVCAACSVHVFNWRILLLLSILLAQKVIDDKSLGTNQFKELFAYATKNMISVVLPTPKVIKMELYLLDVLEYRVNITCTEHSTCARELRGNIITM